MKRALHAWLVGGFVFLYGPILLLVVLSFNASRLTTGWSGFSLRWYGALLADPALREAAWLSLRIGVLSACLATVLGGLAGMALARLRPPLLFGALVAAPLVLPDLLIGLALLLLFVALQQALGWPDRGALTIVLAHATVGLAYVAVVVRGRLAREGTALEEAAMDLGATPFAAFLHITLPRLAPGLAAGWLLAFTLSLDDVVIASFTSGPGATTLPMLVFSTLRLGPTPVLYALATVMLVLAGLALAVAARAIPARFR